MENSERKARNEQIQKRIRKMLPAIQDIAAGKDFEMVDEDSDGLGPWIKIQVEGVWYDIYPDEDMLEREVAAILERITPKEIPEGIWIQGRHRPTAPEGYLMIPRAWILHTRELVLDGRGGLAERILKFIAE